MKYFIICFIPYLYFTILYILIRRRMRKNGNKKTCLCSYYFEIVKHNNLNTNKLNMFFRAYEKLIKFLFSLVIIIPITILVYYFNGTILNSYFTSDAALRFLKHLFESSLTVVIATIGLITLFSSFNKQYFIFFSANDVLKTWSIKENIISIMNKFILITLSATIYYFVFYITIIDKFTSFILVYAFVFANITSLFFLEKIYKLIKAIFKLVFDDKSELTLLDQMHKSIYLKNRKVYKNLTKEDENEIEDNIDYLLNKFQNAPQPSTSNEIVFLSFLQHYKTLPSHIKFVCFLRSYIENIMVTLLITFLVSSTKVIHFDVKSVFWASFFFNLLFLIAIYSFNGLRDVYVVLNLGSFGFKIITSDKKVYYYTTEGKTLIRKKPYRYFVSLYNIISLFRNVLSSNEEISKIFYEKIIESSKNDYLLYSICTFLYYDQYRDKTAELLSKFYHYLNDNKLDINLVKRNTTNLVINITRDATIISEIEQFFADVQNYSKT